jgi:hypothetical protein
MIFFVLTHRSLTRLWVANVDYLRFQDLNLDGEGRVPTEQQGKHMVEPGKGISFFLERKLPEVLVLYDPSTMEVPKKEQKSVHWWGIDQNHPIPSGLKLVYDGHPPGHCTLTVTRQMTVLSYLSLVAQITFSHRQLDVAVPRTYKKA